MLESHLGFIGFFSMGHSHDHHHSHNLSHYNRVFALGVLLNMSFVIVEFIYGVLADSLALVADAAHNLSDVAGLLLAWGATWLAARRPTGRRTYGWRRLTIFASLVSSILLLMGLGIIAWEAVQRFFKPALIDNTTVIVVATIGVLINAATAKLLASGHKHDLNIRAAYLHMIADAAVSAGVVLSALVISFTAWVWLDPATSLLIVVVILVGTWRLFRESAHLAVDGVPEGIDPEAVRRYLDTLPAVVDCHHLHIWAVSTTENALTVHLVIKGAQQQNNLIDRINSELKMNFRIQHATIQIELDQELETCVE